MEKYILTGKGYMFVVFDKLDESKMMDCSFFQTKKEMYDAAMLETGLDFIEVDGAEMIIKDGKETCPRRLFSNLMFPNNGYQFIEEYIRDWKL